MALMTSAKRTSGVAPLGVFFDAVDTVADGGTINKYTWTSGVYQPSDILGSTYVWDFGDSSAGVWTPTGLSRNTATGFTAAHVYETPGTYTATLTQTDTLGIVRTYTQTITVTAFSGTTYYVAANGSDSNNGLSTGAAFLTAAKAWTMQGANVQILFRRGDTFTVNTSGGGGTSNGTITANGPGIVGAYGTGARPIFSGSGDGFCVRGNDWRVMDIHAAGSTADTSNWGFVLYGGATVSDVTFMRCYTYGYWVGYGWTDWGTAVAAPNNGIMHWECEADNGSGYGSYVGGYQNAIIGCNFHDPWQTHVLRVWTGHKYVLSNNRLYNPSTHSTALRHALKLMSSSLTDPSRPQTRWVSISDNRMRGQAYAVAIGAQDQGSNELPTHIVYERNKHVGEATVVADMYVHASDLVIRNNVFDANGSQNDYDAMRILWETGAVYPVPDNVRIYNNTIYRTGTSSAMRGVRILGGVTNVVVRNNLLVPGSGTGTSVDSSGAGAGFAQSNNLSTTNPLFTNAAGGDFSLAAGSPAINAGTTVPEVRYDFLWLPRPAGASYDIGAYEYGATNATFSETDVSLSGSTPIRLDSAPLAGRTWVRVTNPHASLRVFIGHSSGTTTARAECASAIHGAWEDNVGAGVPIYAVSETGAAITVRLTQRI